MSHLELMSIDALPASVDAFGALRDKVARTPEGGAAMRSLPSWCTLRMRRLAVHA